MAVAAQVQARGVLVAREHLGDGRRPDAIVHVHAVGRVEDAVGRAVVDHHVGALVEHLGEPVLDLLLAPLVVPLTAHPRDVGQAEEAHAGDRHHAEARVRDEEAGEPELTRHVLVEVVVAGDEHHRLALRPSEPVFPRRAEPLALVGDLHVHAALRLVRADVAREHNDGRVVVDRLAGEAVGVGEVGDLHGLTGVGEPRGRASSRAPKRPRAPPPPHPPPRGPTRRSR